MNSDLQPPAPGRPEVSLQEEGDRLLLSNEKLVLAFSRSALGTLVGLLGRESQADFLNAQEAQTEGWLWRLALCSSDGQDRSLTNREASEFSHVFTPLEDGSGRLELRWQFPDLSARASITLTPGAGLSFWQFRAEGSEGLRLQEVCFPGVCAIGPEIAERDGLFLPQGAGLLVRSPRRTIFLQGKEERRWRGCYPGALSMQFCGYQAAALGSLYLAAYDGSASPKEFLGEGMPQSDRFLLTVREGRAASSPESTLSAGYYVALGIVPGGYYEAAKTYRIWAQAQPWCAQGCLRDREERSPMSLPGALWLSQEGEAGKVVPAAHSLQRVTNHSVRLHWRPWHGRQSDHRYPDYFPPRDGEEQFREALRQLSRAGILVELTLDGVRAAPDSRAWAEENLESLACSPPPGQAEAPGQTGEPAGRAREDLVPMCLSSPGWRRKLSELAKQVAAFGANGVFLEGLAEGAGQQCQAAEHAHPKSGAGAPLALLGKELRQSAPPGFQLAADSCQESGLSAFDSVYAAEPRWESRGGEAAHQEDQWEPIPLFQAVYHEYAPLIGPASFLGNREGRPGGVHLDQFCYELARSFVWGNQLMLADFDESQLVEEENRRKLSFLAAALRAQSWGGGDFFWMGEFLGTLELESELVEIQFSVDLPGESAGGRRTARRSLPRVLGSAWRGHQGAVMAAIVNFTGGEAQFAGRLNLRRLGVLVPLRAVGRTFFEAGDRAARLRAVGSDLLGRLPARSFTLVAL